MSATKKEPQNGQENTSYVEVTIPPLSERDAIAVVNSIRYPAKPNELLKETLRKYRERP